MRWTLVGASTIASQYVIAAIRAHGGEVSHLVSGDEERACGYAESHGIAKHGTSVSEAVDDSDIDAVYISSTNEKHFPQAMAAIEAGKHVLCEKPLALTLEDAVSMVRAAETAGVVFATNHHLRCSGSHRAIKQLVDEGRIGDVLSMRVHHAVALPPNLQGWRIDSKAAGGGVVLDITVHDADTVRFILGEDPVSLVAETAVSGMGKGVEDSAMSVWTMPSGAMVMAHESFTHRHAGSGLQVHGTKGSIIARGVMTQQPVGKIMLRTDSDKEDVPFSDHDLYYQAVGDFVSAATGSGRPAADGWDGVKSLAVALAVLKAADTGARQAVQYET